MKILKRPWTLRFTLTSLLLVSLGALAIVMLSIGMFGWQQITLSSAKETANANTKLTELRLKNLIEPAATALRVISEYPISNKNLGYQFKYLPIMEQELKANPLISAVYIGFANGDFIAIRALNNVQDISEAIIPDGADYILQVVHNSQQNKTESYNSFFKYGGQLISDQIESDFDLVPQERLWYENAIKNHKINISEPYTFFSTRQIGITLSKQNNNKNAVIGMDIALGDIGSVLESIKITPNTELALVSNNGNLIGYKDMQSILDLWLTDNFTNEILPDINVLQDNPLVKAYDQNTNHLDQFEYQQQKWLGIKANMGNNLSMQLVMAIPMHELLGKAYAYMQLMLALAVLIIILALLWSWWAAGKLSKYLDQLVNQAHSIVRFDFSKKYNKSIPIREIVDLQLAANNVSQTLDSMLSISNIIGSEAEIDTMLQQVLEQTVGATHCISGSVYIWDKSKMYRSAFYGMNIADYPEELDYDPENASSTEQSQDTIGNNQRLSFILRDRNKNLQGLLMLEFEQHKQHQYGTDFHAFVIKLTGMLEAAIEARQLINAQKDLFYGMIHMLADAIDAKSPYTGGHCKRVPQLAIMLIEDLQSCRSGPYADFNLNEQEIKEFSIAAWLHDCGKIVIPQDIVDKASKLEMIYNRIHEIRMRFEVLLRDAEIDYLKNTRDSNNNDTAWEKYQQARAKLLDDFEFVANCNIGSEFLDNGSINRLKEIGSISWLRNFDDLLGLPEVELKQRSKGRNKSEVLPVTERLLADHEYDNIDWDRNDLISQLNHDNPSLHLNMEQPALKQNTGELYNLTIRKGTLTEEDRFIIKNHMVQTLLMLNKLPWPPGFENIPNIAGNHHERMDGNGYPRKLMAGDLPISHRVLAIADVFEALTASDRPYKDTKSISESLNIMAKMCLEHHLDTDLFIYFLENKVWLKYGNRFLNPQQIDDVDIDKIKDLLVA